MFNADHEIIDLHMRAVHKALEPIMGELDQGQDYSMKDLDHFFKEVDQAREAWEDVKCGETPRSKNDQVEARHSLGPRGGINARRLSRLRGPTQTQSNE